MDPFCYLFYMFAFVMMYSKSCLVCGVFCEFVTFPWYPGSGVVLDCIDS